MMEAMRDGGWGMFPTMIFGLVLLAVATRYCLSPEQRWVPLLISLGTLTLFTGSLGFVTGLIAPTRYVSGDLPERAMVSIVGVGESLNNVAFALCFVVLATLAVCVGAFRQVRAEGAPAR